MYLMSISIGICMETSQKDHCDVKYIVLDNVKLPKKPCNWNSGFTFSGNNSKFIAHLIKTL